ncbi:MAG: putative thioesterase [Hydrocarboniphaga sp.]|uniref:acyl-CoA thioesterase n=1 Tax=Hydrocarboniphaga sp. TaxID=2033016 RepID=UPI002620AC7B|nr:thioesterase family protein [Hydrocarboniphaga sp.]MDB5971897.1 putative thioesterase [Hydrocarboniphaga sp.]
MSSKPDYLDDLRMRERATYPFWFQDHVRWSDTDMMGHANNLAFAGFCESGRARLLQVFMHQEAQPRILVVLAEMRIRYLGEAKWPAVIDIGTCVTTISQRACWMAQGLFDGERCICVAESALVVVDETTHRPREMPEPLRELLAGHHFEFGESQLARAAA